VSPSTTVRVASPKQVLANVQKWRKDHGLDKPKPPFRNEPRVLKLSNVNVTIQLDANGEAQVVL